MQWLQPITLSSSAQLNATEASAREWLFKGNDHVLTEASEKGNWCYSRAASLKEAGNPNVRLSVLSVLSDCKKLKLRFGTELNVE